ncbi:uncharacterized protein LOC124167744 isoform X2 [Ischnura elegans]|nr:uncharacterized protein LOC124167744 isoform X2 [Ischnura elegans]
MESPLLSSLRKIVSDFEDNKPELRKTFIYLLLNSNFSFVGEVAKDDNFCHIVDSAPSVDKFLLVKTISMLEFNEFVCEMIIYGHLAMCLEYLEVLLSEVRVDKSLLTLASVENILSSLNARLLALSGLTNGQQNMVEEFKCGVSYYFKEFLSIYFYPPQKENELGYIVKSLLSLLQSCLCHRLNSVSEVEDIYKIYSLSLSDCKIDSPSSTSIKLEKNEDIICLINALGSNLNAIDLSTWLSWSECEWQTPVDSSVSSRTLQEVIGLQAFLCRQKLEKFCKDLPEAVKLSDVLKNMEIKPVTDEDEIEKVQDVSEIIFKIKETDRSPESRKKWLLALMKFSWNSKEEECVDCIQQFIDLLNCMEGIYLLQKKVGEILMNSSEPSDLDSEEKRCSKITEPLKNKMRNVVFQAYPQVTGDVQGNLVGNFFEDFGLTNCYMMEDFEGKAIQTMNKAVNANEAMDQLVSDISVLCLQSPVDVIRRLLVLGVGCHSQITFVVEVLKNFSSVCLSRVNENSFSKYSKDQSIDRGICILCHQLSFLMKQKNWNETENSNLLRLVTQCIESSLLPKENFIEKCIIPGLEDCMEHSYWDSMNIYLEILNAVLTLPSLSLKEIANPAPILAYILLILEKGRYEMRKYFSVPAASTCELIISQLPVLLEKMLDQASFQENDLEWLRTNVLSASPTSQYYFSKLWPDHSSDIIRDFKSLILFLVCDKPDGDEKRLFDLVKKESSPLSYTLYKLLPSCTTSEWLNFVNAMKMIISEASEKMENIYWNLFHLISSVLIVLIKMANKKYLSGEKNIPYCIELWFKSYMRIVKDEFLPCCEYFDRNQIADVFMMIIIIVEEVPADENIRETCSFLALNILSTIAEMLITSSFEKSDIGQNPVAMKIISCLSLMSVEASKKGLARKVMELLNK